MKPFRRQELPIGKIQSDSLIPMIGKQIVPLPILMAFFNGIANPDVLLSPPTTQEAVISSKIEGTKTERINICEGEKLL